MVIGTLAVDGWAVTFGTARRGCAGCTSFILFDGWAVTFGTARRAVLAVPASYYLMWHYNCLWALKG